MHANRQSPLRQFSSFLAKGDWRENSSGKIDEVTSEKSRFGLDLRICERLAQFLAGTCCADGTQA